MNNFPFALTDKIAVVTGGGTGLGFGISKALTEAGSKVVITGVNLPVDRGNSIGF